MQKKADANFTVDPLLSDYQHYVSQKLRSKVQPAILRQDGQHEPI